MACSGNGKNLPNSHHHPVCSSAAHENATLVVVTVNEDCDCARYSDKSSPIEADTVSDNDVDDDN